MMMVTNATKHTHTTCAHFSQAGNGLWFAVVGFLGLWWSQESAPHLEPHVFSVKSHSLDQELGELVGVVDSVEQAPVAVRRHRDRSAHKGTARSQAGAVSYCHFVKGIEDLLEVVSVCHGLLVEGPQVLPNQTVASLSCKLRVWHHDAQL